MHTKGTKLFPRDSKFSYLQISTVAWGLRGSKNFSRATFNLVWSTHLTDICLNLFAHETYLEKKFSVRVYLYVMESIQLS